MRAKARTLCPDCKAPINHAERFCRRCGASLNTSSIHSEPIAARSSLGPEIHYSAEQIGTEVPDGERKTVTAVFADMKGSTELMAELDPEEARSIIDPALKL